VGENFYGGIRTPVLPWLQAWWLARRGLVTAALLHSVSEQNENELVLECIIVNPSSAFEVFKI